MPEAVKAGLGGGGGGGGRVVQAASVLGRDADDADTIWALLRFSFHQHMRFLAIGHTTVHSLSLGVGKQKLGQLPTRKAAEGTCNLVRQLDRVTLRASPAPVLPPLVAGEGQPGRCERGTRRHCWAEG